MKTPFALVAVMAFGFAGNASAKGNDNTSSNSGGSAPHHASTTTTATVAPLFNGVPHYSGAMPYRPAVSYRNGSRTFNYPAVGLSTLRHPTHSGGSNFNNAYALQRSGNSPHLSDLNTACKTTLTP